MLRLIAFQGCLRLFQQCGQLVLGRRLIRPLGRNGVAGVEGLEVGAGDFVMRIELQGAFVGGDGGFLLSAAIQAHGEGEEVLHILRLQLDELAINASGIVVAFLLEIYLGHKLQHLGQLGIDLHRESEGGFKFIEAIGRVAGHRQSRVGEGIARG